MDHWTEKMKAKGGTLSLRLWIMHPRLLNYLKSAVESAVD